MQRFLTLLLFALALAACASGGRGPADDALSFAAMQSINPGVDGEWILAEYPFARQVRRHPNGRVQFLGYTVEDPQGKSRPLALNFDENGILASKEYGGPIIRAPEGSQ